MPHVIVNGQKLPVRLVEIDLAKLKLDPENPRLHSAYLTHRLAAKPSQAQIQEVLEQLPEFQNLLTAIARNEGCFQPPLVAVDSRVLEGNRRVAALRVLRARAERGKWKTLTVAQLVDRLSSTQEQAVRAKYHLEGALAWDALSQLAEYLALSEREGREVLAGLLGRFAAHLEPLLVAARCVRRFSAQDPEQRSSDDLWALIGLCGVKQIAPKVVFSRSTCVLFTHTDEQRPEKQPYSVEQVFRWVGEGRFTRAYHDEDGRQTQVRPEQVPARFRQVRQAGEQALSYFLEAEGSLAKAVASLEAAKPTISWQHQRALTSTRRYVDLLNQMKPIRREDSPELYRDAVACYHRLGDLLGLAGKERS